MKRLLLFCIVIFTLDLSAQESQSEKIFLIIPQKADPYWVSEKGKNIVGSNNKINSGKKTDLVVHYEGMEHSDTVFTINVNKKNTIRVSDKFRNIEIIDKEIILKPDGRAPASVDDNPYEIKEKMYTPLQCKNHTPPHTSTDPKKFLKTCCFVSGCQ
ncbi:MAG: hypothetical protein U0T73_04665 [Chitinophagales bacterium]